MVTDLGLDAIRVGNASQTYNCHSYAWYMSEGGSTCWINSPGDDYFWSDAAYSNDGTASYITCSVSEATHVSYVGDSHSVRKIKNSYPMPQQGTKNCVSKWGKLGLYIHALGSDPYEETGYNYYKLKTTHNGTMTNYPKTWVGAGGKTHTLSGNTELQSNLKIKSGASVNLNSGYYIKAINNGSFTLENNVSIGPDIRRKNSSNVLKGLYPSISTAINDRTVEDKICLGNGTFYENVSMLSYCTLAGAGMNSTSLYGDVGFTNVTSSDILNMTVYGDISVDGGSNVSVHHLKARDVIDVDLGSNHEVANVTTTVNGYIELYQTEPDIDDINSINSLNYGVSSYEADFEMDGGVYENKSRAVYSIARADAQMYDIEFCNNVYDIYGGESSAMTVWTMGTMSSCNPLPVYGNVTFYDDCVSCESLLKSSPEINNNIYTLPLEGIDGSPEGLKYTELRNLYRSIKAEISADHKDSIRYDISKYAPKYNQVIAGMKAFVTKSPDTEYAKHALKFIDYSYRALEQQDAFAEYLTALGKDAKYKSLQTTIKSQFIPYYLGKGEYETALNLTDEVMKAQTEPENALYYLYRKGVIYHKYIKDTAKAEEIYKQVIDTDPNSAMAFSAGVRLGKLGKVYEGENKTNAAEPEMKFAIRNHPNPFNPTTNIQFDLPEADHVTIKVYDIQGREVITLVDAQQGEGSHNVMWNSQDKFGQRVASGMYFYRIEYRGQVLTNKMILMR